MMIRCFDDDYDGHGTGGDNVDVEGAGYELAGSFIWVILDG